MSKRGKIKKSLRLVFVDFFALLVGILNGFFLPAVFSIEGYASFRVFTLYATYAVVFSLGLSDGLYLKYGGKKESEINKSEVKAYYYFLIKLQMVILLALFIISYFVLKDQILVFFSLFIMPLQLIHFFRLFYRAVGEFDKYSFLQVGLVILELLNTLFIVFIYKPENPNLFITIKIINHAIVALVITIFFIKRNKSIESIRIKLADYFELMKAGILVLAADMAAAFMFSLDRWFIMFYFDKREFAYYSFAVSILTIFLVFIASITNIFYSHISKKVNDHKYITLLKKIVLVFSSFFPIAYFVLKFIIERFLPKYTNALGIIWILIIMVPFVSIVNVIYINLYKASKNIKIYLKRMIVLLIISALLNITAILIFASTEAVAFATLITFIIWYFYSSKDFEPTKINGSEILYLAVIISSFIIIKSLDISLLLSIVYYLMIAFLNILIYAKVNNIRINEKKE